MPSPPSFGSVSSRPSQPRYRTALGASREAWRNLGAFRAAFGWLLRDLITFSRTRVVGVAALNLTGVVLQWAVVGGVLIFVGELTGEGGAFQAPLLGGVELPVSASIEVVAGWSLIVLLLVVAAAASTYGAEALGFRTALRYVDHRGGNILGAMLAARTMPATDRHPPARQLQVVLARDQIMVLRALLVLQRALRAILMVAVAAAVLALINPFLTAVVAFVTCLFVVPYYLVNRRMVSAANALEQRNLNAKLSISRLVEHATTRDPNAEVERLVPAMYASDTAIAERWSVLRDIMLGGQRTAAVMTGLVGTCLVAVVVAFSLIIARDNASWVAALTYILGLNLAAGAFAQLASQVTAANRFLPHIQEYVGFLARLGPAPHAPAGDGPVAPSARLPPLRASEPTLPDSATELWLTPESRVLCIWPEPTDRLNVQVLLGRLVGRARAERLREAAFFYGEASGLPPVPLHALLGPRGLEALSAIGLADEVLDLPERDATVLTPRVTEGLTPLLRYVLGLLDGIDRQVLILAWKPFAKLSAEDRGRVLEIVGARPVLFTYSAGPSRQPAEISHTVVLTRRGVAGMGDGEWYKSVAGDVQAGAAIQARAAAGVSIDDIADDA